MIASVTNAGGGPQGVRGLISTKMGSRKMVLGESKDKGNHNLVKDINLFYLQLCNWAADHSLALVSILMARGEWLII